MAKKKRPIKTDVNIHYLVPMCRLSSPSSPTVSERREVKIISSNEGMIRCQVVEDAELFEIHSFWDEYFQWLIYTGYIIPLTDSDSNLPDHVHIPKDDIEDWDSISEDKYEDVIKDYLSEHYGCCPENFSYSVLNTLIGVWGITWPNN